MPAATTSPREPQSTPSCAWCSATDELQSLVNPWDSDVLVAEPSLLWLCPPCLVESGLRTDEPDACAEHRAGCPAGAHLAEVA